MGNGVELGLDTFGDVTADGQGRLLSHAQVLRNVVIEAVLADELGLDVIGVGEHHRPDFAISAPEVMLAAIAGQTTRIRLSSAVTVLSSDDPVRVYERFATLDGLSGGRAEVILGRGSFTESFPLFGYDLAQYDLLFEEKLELFARLREGGPVTWSGRTRAPLHEQRLYPPVEGRLAAWVAVGGSPHSVLRAARHGLPLMLAIIGGMPLRFAPLVQLFRQSLQEEGREPLPVGVHSPGYLAASDQQAREEAWPHYRDMHERIGRERGWQPLSRAQYEAMAGPEGALFIGSPATVADKIVRVVRGLELDRFTLKYSLGTLPHERLMEGIRLYATEVAPLVRAQMAGSPSSGATEDDHRRGRQ